MNLALISARLVELLGLTRPPVALRFAGDRPSAVAGLATGAPAVCSFWRRAEGTVFYASAEEHLNCPVGAMVMGFGLSVEASQHLGDLVKFMCGESYITENELTRIPTVRHEGAGILYGPLAGFPTEPDVILMRLIPHRAMIFSEALGTANWAEHLMQVSGRPACAALARAIDRHRSGLSLGSTGMRMFMGIGGEEMLAIVPGDHAEALVAALKRAVNANEALRSYYRQEQAQFSSPAGHRPTRRPPHKPTACTRA